MKVIDGVKCRRVYGETIITEYDFYDDGYGHANPCSNVVGMRACEMALGTIWRPIKTKPAKSEGRRKTLDEIYDAAYDESYFMQKFGTAQSKTNAFRAVERAVIKRERRRICREVMERVGYVSLNDASWMERVMKEVAPC